MLSSLDRLERAVESIVKSAEGSPDEFIASRVSAYREIVRRQRALISQLSAASLRRDFREVRRLSSLVHGSSLMIKVDVGFLLSSIKAQTSPTTSA
jgi:hypothetical protein